MWDNLEHVRQFKNEKVTFRKLVNTQVRDLARDYLLNLKNKNSKLNNLSEKYTFDLYLTSMNITTEEKQTLFKFRTKMVEVNANFKSHFVMKKKPNSILCLAKK